MADEHGRSEESAHGQHTNEFSASEPEPGYWAGRWTEFKRLFIKFAWEDEHSRVTLILSAVMILVALFGSQFLGWR